MSFLKVYPKDQRPLVGLFSEPNCLAVALVEKLLANFCRVEIIARDQQTWREKLKSIQMRGLVNFSFLKTVNEKAIDYAVFIDSSPKAAIEFSQRKKIKTLAILPYRNLFNKERPSLIPEDVGLIFVGDLLGPRMDLVENSALGRYLLATLRKKPIQFPSDEVLFPVFIGAVAQRVSQWLFSFGPYGRQVALLSGRRELTLPSGVERINLSFNLDAILKQTLSWFALHPPRKAVKAKPVRFPLILGLSALLVLLLSPFLLIFLSGFSLLLVQKNRVGRNLSATQRILSVGEISASIAVGETRLISQAPGLEKLYQPTVLTARILRNSCRIGLKTTGLIETGVTLATKILGNEPYDIFSLSGQIELKLASILEELLFLESEIKSQKGTWQAGLIRKSVDFDLKEIKNYLGQAKILVNELPEILGGQKKKNYLILLQNNMELRPTGGFIGSFALITLDGGRVAEVVVQDVYAADGQLKGHIEPPAAIKKYLKEANWYLRDSNWDPDFPTSAERAEWFLDKELDLAVDGVIAIDLKPIKDLLAIIGPIVLTDFGIELKAENFYEKTQAEVEKDFFPGSYRKSGFLTALNRTLSERLASLPRESFLPFFRVFFNNLNERHLQIFLHNPKARRVIASLNWDGSAVPPSCPDNCLFDWFGLVEANVGVNKANYYLERNFSLDVGLDQEGKIEETLVVTYKNSANPALGTSAIYKVFARLLLPPDAVAKNFSLASGTSVQTLDFTPEFVSGKQEVGGYFEIIPGQTKTLLLQWGREIQPDFSQPGKYRLFWRKQAGVGEDPVEINFHFPALTKGEEDRYNRLFVQDILLDLIW